MMQSGVVNYGYLVECNEALLLFTDGSLDHEQQTPVVGIRWSVSAAENDGESGGRFPTLRHTFVGVDW